MLVLRVRELGFGGLSPLDSVESLGVGGASIAVETSSAYITLLSTSRLLKYPSYRLVEGYDELRFDREWKTHPVSYTNELVKLVACRVHL